MQTTITGDQAFMTDRSHVFDTVRLTSGLVSSLGLDPRNVSIFLFCAIFTFAVTAAAKRRDGFDVRRTTLMTGTLEDHMAHLQAMKRGEIVEVPPVYMAVLSASDPTIAPAGQDVLYLHSNVSADPVGGWQANKDLYTQTIVKSAERFLSGLDAENGRIVHTPKDFEDHFSTPKGCYFHVDMTPLRLGANRPARGLGGYTTPFPGLYLAGAGSHPGGTVNGWCGRLAAQQAIREETNAR